jgi:hypothetical protein
MSWYLAVLVRGSHVKGALDEGRPGDLLYRLVEADDPDEAYASALELGKDSLEEYEDDDGAAVRLSFLGLSDLIEIPDDALGHGTEVYSQILPDSPGGMVVTRNELTVFEEGVDLDETAPEDPRRHEG